MEGWLLKKGEKGIVKGWKRRFFRQQRDQLMYYRSDTSQESLGTIPLHEVYAIHPSDFKDRLYTFQISTEQRIFYLQAETEDQFHYWSLGLSGYIKRAGTQDRLVLKHIEAEKEKVEEPHERKSILTRKRSKSKSTGEPKRETQTIQVPGKSDSFLPQSFPMEVPTKPMPSPPTRESSISSADELVARPPSLGSLKPLPRPPSIGKVQEDENEDSVTSNEDENETNEAYEANEEDEINEEPKRIIGRNVIAAATPSRKPPAPPQDDEDDPVTIRVAGIVSPRVSKELESKKERPTTWITRTESTTANGSNSHPQFLHTRSPANLFPQDNNTSHRTKLVCEVVSSEENYVASLNTLVYHYLIPLRSHQDKRVSKEVKQIFGNIEQILALNTDLLSRFQTRINEWSDKQLLGDIFIRIAPFLKLYATYGTNYEIAINLYQKEMKENLAFKDAVELRNLEAGTSVHLHHLLIMPIQRIPRYNMLLSDIIKNTEQTHPDYNNLVQALSSTKQVATHLNESVRESELERNLADLAERMEITLLLAPHRRLLREGSFRIIVGKKEKRNFHHLILFNDILVCISRSKIRKPSEFTSPQNNFPLSLVWFSEIKNEVNKQNKTLTISNPTYSFQVLFENSDEFSAWMKSLTRGVSTALKSQPTNEDKNSRQTENQLPGLRYGSFIYPDGSSYTGWFLNGQKQGPGSFSFSFNHYEGNFLQNKMSGNGKITYPAGEMYTGQWENGLPHGDGTFGTPTGDVYDGSWVDGRKEGNGKYKYSNGDSYDGQWQQDLPHGSGKCVYATGKRYDGEWVKGQRSGTGTMDYGNASNYEGEWLLDRCHGRGTYVLNDGSYYEGEFVNGLYEGTGVMVYKDGRKFSGQWRAGKPNGSGTFSSAIGSVIFLEAEWMNGTVQGKGTLNFSNGNSFVGYFRDNWFHGTGTFINQNVTIEGRWNFGNLEGKISVRVGENDPIIGMVVNGMYIHTGDEFSPPLMLPHIPSFISVEL